MRIIRGLFSWHDSIRFLSGRYTIWSHPPPRCSVGMKRARNRTRGGGGGGGGEGGGGYARSTDKERWGGRRREKERKRGRRTERKEKKERTYSPEVVRAPWVPRDTRVTMHRMCTNKGICLGARLWGEIYDDVKQGPTLHPSRERESSPLCETRRSALVCARSPIEKGPTNRGAIHLGSV